ncbi:MAG: hypothetical protein NTY98_03610 [Verrucomicrobia bacterium]|nr:hypothetical protein [Verrucomicrobiota bacterium]
MVQGGDCPAAIPQNEEKQVEDEDKADDLKHGAADEGPSSGAEPSRERFHRGRQIEFILDRHGHRSETRLRVNSTPPFAGGDLGFDELCSLSGLADEVLTDKDHRNDDDKGDHDHRDDGGQTRMPEL